MEVQSTFLLSPSPPSLRLMLPICVSRHPRDVMYVNALGRCPCQIRYPLQCARALDVIQIIILFCNDLDRLQVSDTRAEEQKLEILLLLFYMELISSIRRIKIECITDKSRIMTD